MFPEDGFSSENVESPSKRLKAINIDPKPFQSITASSSQRSDSSSHEGMSPLISLSPVPSPAKPLSNKEGFDTDPMTLRTRLHTSGSFPLQSLLECDREPLSDPLYQYQREGVEFLKKAMRGNIPGAILADETGLGKTIQSLALLAEKYSTIADEERQTSLIVVPSALVSQWESEIKRWLQPKFPHITYYVYENTRTWKDFSALRQNDIVITTYEMLKRDPKRKENGTHCLTGDGRNWDL